MSTYIENFKRFRPLLNELVSRDIKIKYRRSIMGVLWTLLNPLLMIIVLSIVFSNLFKFDLRIFTLSFKRTSYFLIFIRILPTMLWERLFLMHL